ncbi:MAG: MFS transporter [Deltaproteobacteria bacterium]|nr:MFS transporter [Deltaproteobacteria bacterium]
MEEKQYQLSRRAAYTTLIVLSILQLIDFADRSILAISLPYIKNEFSLTDKQAGMLPALLQLGIAIFTVPSAMLADRWARRKIIPLMDLVWSTFTLLTSLATRPWHLFVARFMVGSGEAGYAVAGQTWLSVIFPKSARSRVISIFTMCHQLGLALGLFMGGFLISRTGMWQVPFYFFGFIGLAMAFVVYFLPDYKVSNQNEALFDKAYFRSWGEIFRIRTYVFNMIGLIFLYAGANSIPSWTPTLLMRAYGSGVAKVGMTLGFLGLLTFFSPLGGFLADRWQGRDQCGRLKFTTLLIIVTMPVGIVLWASAGIIPFYLWMVGYGFLLICLAFLHPVTQTIMHDVVPVRVRASAFGTQNFIAQLLGGFTGPLLVGVISDSFRRGIRGLKWGLGASTAVMALTIITMTINMKYYPSDSSKISDVVLAEK